MHALRLKWIKLATWLSHQILLPDSLLAIFLTWLFSRRFEAPIFSDGFIVPKSHANALFFSIILGFPLIIRRFYPELAANIFIVIFLVQLLFGPTFIPSDVLGYFMLYSVLIYGNRKLSRRYIVISFVLVAVKVFIASFNTIFGSLSYWVSSSNLQRTSDEYFMGCSTGDSCTHIYSAYLFANMFISYSLLLFVIFCAFWNRSRKAALRSMRERNAAIADRQKEQRQLAASAERARIARDMHDVVAHTLSIVIIQSDAGRYAGSSNPSLALQILKTIRREANHALHDIDNLFDTFDDSNHGVNPSKNEQDRTNNNNQQATLTIENNHTTDNLNNYHGIDDLVRQARSTSPDLELDHVIEGTPEPGELSTEASLASYRCVQESLSNIRKHAGSHAHAVIQENWTANSFQITITNDIKRKATTHESSCSSGYGLIGMIERIEALGGQVEAGVQSDNTFTVHATIPLCGESNESISTTSDKQQVLIADKHNSALDSRASNKPYEFGTSEGLNRIERLSRWAAHHYLLVDALLGLMSVVLITVLNTDFFMGDSSIFPPGNPVPQQTSIIQIICISVPLIFRRRFPNLSAASIALITAVELIAASEIELINYFVVVSIYSAMAYGRGKTRIWVPIAVACELVLSYMRVFINVTLDYSTIIDWIIADRSLLFFDYQHPDFNTIFIFMFLETTSCACALVLGLWRRTSGSSILLQKERKEILQQSEGQQQRLAANAERARIGKEIQSEVSSTLSQVVSKTNESISMMMESHNRDTPLQASDIDQAFASIGQEGRSALTRMRYLLDILRQTSQSDSNQDNTGTHSSPPLEPINLQQ